ncbi:hypothetical protein NCCP2716_27870 [Sporosarcina sp. NCCP-2716]|uniref:hypothetical protein n=1 Tax=Sporosarcina sp. NCCP-2716 TaxID=2943679 RepID=UPI0020426A93|nr:hypothetical protein [Sporosarcina sp. NCCP-2716]GKV70289.1 hypothetical protein NCCP2716_27870 [Sporosarcina sp. NCCP-2716]
MSEATKFFAEYQREILLSVATLAPGKVISYNPGTKRATIQPLFLTADEENIYEQSPIFDAPVLKHCQADCKVGAAVFYIPAQRSLAGLNGTSFIDPDSHDLMSSNDAVVVGVWDG